MRHYSYITRGFYAEQLEGWLQFYPRDRLLVIKSEDLFEHPEKTYRSITAFLDIRPWLPGSFSNYSYRDGKRPDHGNEIDRGLRDRLSEVFAEPNRRLEALLGSQFTW